MADIYVEYLPEIDNPAFDLAAKRVVDLLRTYLTDHDGKKVTNGDAHDHAGGDGGQIAHSGLSGIAPTWTEVSSFSNSWVNYGAAVLAAYTKDAHGWVHVKGRIKDGTLGSKAFTLPTGYRPDGVMQFGVVSNSAFGVLTIQADGDVIPTVVGDNASFFINADFYVG